MGTTITILVLLLIVILLHLLLLLPLCSLTISGRILFLQTVISCPMLITHRPITAKPLHYLLIDTTVILMDIPGTVLIHSTRAKRVGDKLWPHHTKELLSLSLPVHPTCSWMFLNPER